MKKFTVVVGELSRPDDDNGDAYYWHILNENRGLVRSPFSNNQLKGNQPTEVEAVSDGVMALAEAFGYTADALDLHVATNSTTVLHHGSAIMINGVGYLVCMLYGQDEPMLLKIPK